MISQLSITIQDSDQPKNKKIWCVDLCGFDIGCLNSYMLTYDEALKMCETSFVDGEGSDFVVYVPDEHKIKNKKDKTYDNKSLQDEVLSEELSEEWCKVDHIISNALCGK